MNDADLPDDLSAADLPDPLERLEPAARAYLDLLRRCLTREAFLDQEWWDVRLDDWPGGRDAVQPVLAEHGWRLVRRGDPAARDEGRDWPPTAETMVGSKRLDCALRCCIDAVLDDVPGDFIETGVWRGGVTILMRGVLAALGLALAACRDGPVLVDPGLERGTALAPPGLELPRPVAPDKR